MDSSPTWTFDLTCFNSFSTAFFLEGTECQAALCCRDCCLCPFICWKLTVSFLSSVLVLPTCCLKSGLVLVELSPQTLACPESLVVLWVAVPLPLDAVQLDVSRFLFSATAKQRFEKVEFRLTTARHVCCKKCFLTCQCGFRAPCEA